MTAARPLVIVILPTYADRVPRLQSALASIWAQEGLGEKFDLEPIVVDDASSGPGCGGGPMKKGST